MNGWACFLEYCAVLVFCGILAAGCGLQPSGETLTPTTSIPATRSSAEVTPADVPLAPTSQQAEPATVEPLSPGSILLEETGSIEPAQGGIDWPFEAPADLVVRVDIQVLGGFPAYELRLVDPFNNPVAEVEAEAGTQNAAIAEITLPYQGTYRVRVLPVAGSGTLTALVTALAAPSGGGDLEVGQTVSAPLSGENVYHTYTFALVEGQVVSLSVLGEADGLLGTTLSLFGPDGRLAAEVDDSESRNTILSHFVAPLTGNYAALVTNHGATTGTYAFVVESDTVPPIAEGDPDLQFGRDYRLELFEGSDLTLTFDAAIGDVVRVETLSLGRDLRIDMRLFSPFGQVIAFAVDAPQGESENLNEVQLPYTGRYTLGIVPFGQGETTLRLVSLSQDALSGGGVFGDELNAKRSGHLTAPNVFHYYQFNGRAGDSITLSVLSDNSAGNLELGVALLAPDGTQAAFVANQGSVRSRDPRPDSFQLTETGTYTIVVYALHDEARGTYELDFVREES